ncbi:MAG: dihydroorotate dehydrogenase electron transfer subunit [Dysgonamonadaceae bacterium]|jgi:dihydroorotate dehydrogenase electron transfer subunit|nr:dihydroorotate dehydrogenase electron transfer subunit [Dysgonamonadaceae bacterium]
MKKYISDWIIKEISLLNDNHCLLKLYLETEIPDIYPGQFVQIKIENAENVFLRRPISVHYVDRKNNELWLLIQIVGKGTKKLTELHQGDKLNLVYPLGNNFTLPENSQTPSKFLLIGGGVGIAPLLYLGAFLKENGWEPTFLLGAGSAKNLVQLEYFNRLGEVLITTEDGSLGEKGFVTNHSSLLRGTADFIYTCGPKAMMMAVARYAKEYNIPCEVSLENHMACGIGACLCCVEKTTEGNVCVCTEGPVFNINKLSWQI